MPRRPPDFEVLQEFAGAFAERLLPGLLDGVSRSTAEILETVRLEGEASRAAARADAREQSRKLVESVRDRQEEVFAPAPGIEVVEAFDAGDRLAQAELAVTYMAWRTLLCRPGAASIFVVERVTEQGKLSAEGSYVLISSAPFTRTHAGWTLVASISGVASPVHASPSEKGLRVPVYIPDLTADRDLTRLEIWDQEGRPRFVGVGQAFQTNNQARPRERGHLPERIKER
ncbi:MAG TPA: hypothetical protein VMB27_19335 [Solirubrobacteraceae bacterium]|nr:hypothetical protein [Solirubrobacteraceae bacterium]